MKKLPDEMLVGIEDLPGVLEEKCGELSTFRSNPEHLRIFGLNEALGEENPLIPEIHAHMKVHMKVSTATPCSHA